MSAHMKGHTQTQCVVLQWFNSIVLEITWSKLKLGEIHCIAIMVSYCLSKKLLLKYT
jgi:hypothetical protein